MPQEMQGGNTSSHHDPYKLGYTCTTTKRTMGATGNAGANPETFSQFRLLSATRKYEGGIASNRILVEVR